MTFSPRHMRALLQDSPIQVASSDTHTVKPWFNGRVEFSPDVKDFATEGFPLAGGRLDYIGGKRVAALVYRHRLHVIDVFVWPAATAEDIPPRLTSTDGYNLLTWSHGGLTYSAISTSTRLAAAIQGVVWLRHCCCSARRFS